MFGEETALVQVAALGAAIFAATGWLPLPVHLINVILHLIIGPIQAFIFFALGAAYIKMATTHEGGDHHEAEAEEHHEAPSAEQAA
jgi:F0F1-type ATP synthase membrane subunit a